MIAAPGLAALCARSLMRIFDSRSCENYRRPLVVWQVAPAELVLLDPGRYRVPYAGCRAATVLCRFAQWLRLRPIA